MYIQGFQEKLIFPKNFQIFATSLSLVWAAIGRSGNGHPIGVAGNLHSCSRRYLGEGWLALD